jgi:hypothetical protein
LIIKIENLIFSLNLKYSKRVFCSDLRKIIWIEKDLKFLKYLNKLLNFFNHLGLVFISSLQFAFVLTATKSINYENKGLKSFIDLFFG